MQAPPSQALKAPKMRAFLEGRFAAADRAPQYKETSPQRTAALLDVVDAVAKGCAQTAVVLRTTLVQKILTTNEFGDDVLTADLVADKRICDVLGACNRVAAYASEEHPDLTVVNDSPDDNLFTVTFDPLDGSSIIDTNFSVGSIFAVWNGATCVGQKVKEMAMSLVAVYGPRTTLFVAHRSFGVHEFLLVSDDGDWRVVRKRPYEVAGKAKYFSPGNLRSANDLPDYVSFLKYAVRNHLTLRYTGGMVPDVTQIFIKGSGVFATPTAARFKVKLRVCFECGPLAHMMTCAGGAALDEDGVSYMEKLVQKMDQRSGVLLGSADAVERLRGQISTKNETAPPKAKL